MKSRQINNGRGTVTGHLKDGQTQDERRNVTRSCRQSTSPEETTFHSLSGSRRTKLMRYPGSVCSLRMALSG